MSSVEINGAPASFGFVQPTYPGDPNGQDDPDPAAHAVSNSNPVSATNPNPPACSPQVNNDTQNGTQCPANKLVVTPSAPIPDGTTFTVTINYTGRPGVHTDGDGSTEGWFRISTAGSEGAFVTTEPVGNDSWMPMNNHPLAKPTYDIYDTTNIGKVAIGPGELVGYTAPVGTTYQPVPAPASNPPDANFASGSVTWHWHSPEPIANYLVENSIGAYDLSARTSPTSGVQYWEAQASTITAARKAINKIAMDNQEDIVNFQQIFNGPWPMTTDGVVVGTPPASFEEEMQGKITFAGGTIGGATGTSLGTFNHENMHQWFGDNVAEAAFNLTWWKEGFATLGEYLCTARRRRTPAGGLGTRRGDAAFETSLISRFNGTGNYNTTSSTFWTQAPNNPSVEQPLHDRVHVHAAGHGLRRAVAHARQGPDDQRDEGHPEHLRRRQHHAAAARGGLPQVAADPERVVQRAAHRVLHAVVEHVVPERRRQHAEPADAHRPRAQRPGLPVREGHAGRAERPERLVHDGRGRRLVRLPDAGRHDHGDAHGLRRRLRPRVDHDRRHVHAVLRGQLDGHGDGRERRYVGPDLGDDQARRDGAGSRRTPGGGAYTVDETVPSTAPRPIRHGSGPRRRTRARTSPGRLTRSPSGTTR